MKKLTFFVFLFPICFLPLTHADDDSGVYLSASVNRLSADFENSDDVDFDESDNAGGARIGYMFNDLVGLELSYIDLGEYSASGPVPGNEISLDASAFSTALVLNLDLGVGFDLYGKAGVHFIESESQSLVGGRTIMVDEDEVEPFAAIGVEADFGHWNIFGELSSAQTDQNDLSIVVASVGLKYEFGR